MLSSRIIGAGARNSFHKGGKTMSFHHLFTRISKGTSRFAGHPGTFVAAVMLIAVWAITGPMFDYSDTWQLIINTGTTIVTFLMVFLIQSTQNRDTGAIQTKLDELIRAIEGAHNALLDLEELDEAEIEHIRRDYRNLATKARKDIQEGRRDTDSCEVEHEAKGTARKSSKK
jgi:low affinity Fe/Cu permease